MDGIDPPKPEALPRSWRPFPGLLVSPLVGGPAAFVIYGVTDLTRYLVTGSLDPTWRDFLSTLGMFIAFCLYGSFFAAVGLAVLFIPILLIRRFRDPAAKPYAVVTAAVCGLVASHASTLLLWDGTFGDWQLTLIGLGAGAACGWVFRVLVIRPAGVR